MDIFLRAKHWQLFLLTFGIPFILQIVFMVNVFSHIQQSNNPGNIFEPFKYFIPVMIIFCGTLLGWQWSVATGLQKMIPPGFGMNVTTFKVFLIIPVVYMLCIFSLIGYVFSGNFLDNLQGSSVFIVFAVIFPLHLFCMFCLFYCIYFVAKTFKTAELQRPVSVSDYLGEFFLIWFFPIGVWIIQPKINQMLDRYNHATTESLS